MTFCEIFYLWKLHEAGIECSRLSRHGWLSSLHGLVFCDGACPGQRLLGSLGADCLVDGGTVCWKICQLMKHIPLPDHGVGKVGVAIKLVLDQVV